MGELSQSDKRLVSAVVEDDAETFETLLGSAEISVPGVTVALYTASILGRETYVDMMAHDGNIFAYYNGQIIRGVMTDDTLLIEDAVYLGGNIHHDDDVALQVAVLSLKNEMSEYLVERGLDISKAFPPQKMRELYAARKDENLNIGKIIELVSEMKTRAAQNIHRPSAPTFKFF